MIVYYLLTYYDGLSVQKAKFDDRDQAESAWRDQLNPIKLEEVRILESIFSGE
jgi:hypothetical protein